jgi:hypothetical protein
MTVAPDPSHVIGPVFRPAVKRRSSKSTCGHQMTSYWPRWGIRPVCVHLGKGSGTPLHVEDKRGLRWSSDKHQLEKCNMKYYVGLDGAP